jgi:hypothetical protein
MANQNPSSATPATQILDVHSVQSTTPEANQQIEGKKKQNNKKGKGDKKVVNNASEGKNKTRKVKYLCNLCMDDHLTHMFSQLAED